MKNKLIACLTAMFLIVDCALVAATGVPAKGSSQEESVIVEDEAEKPVSPAPPCEPLVYAESVPEEDIEVTSDEYPAAAQVWNAMKAKGWSDEICAGIMGNMMAECGGGTLNLNPYAIGDSGTSFGLCQWHNGRKSNLLNNYGESIEEQIAFLEAEIGDINTYFSNPTDYKAIAYEFCIIFERPSNKEQKGIERKALAQTAFEYFVN